MISGKKYIIFNNGDKYEGDIAFDQPNGKGKMIYADGDVYEGFFKDGEIHGEGKMLYQDGSSYEGHWENGKYEGYGIQILKNGRIGKGLWSNGKPIVQKTKFLIKYSNDNNWYDQFGNKIEQGIEDRNPMVKKVEEKMEIKETPSEIDLIFDEDGIPVGGIEASDIF